MPKKRRVKNSKKVDSSEALTLDGGWNLFISGYGKRQSEESQREFRKFLPAYLKQEIEKIPGSKKYNILVLLDDSSLIKSDADRIYKAIGTFKDTTKPILLVLLSNGGEAGSAYLIGKLCREFSRGKFIVVVPRYAKSAATLLSCAADEIHMGSLSELGPIDPQIGGVPALGLKNSIEHIAALMKKYPFAGDMFAQYLHLSVKPIDIGYYERVAVSAKQYAQRLLDMHPSTLITDPSAIAEKLVYEYKDHGFLIDKAEALDIFGSGTVKTGTHEYELGNKIYNIISTFSEQADRYEYHFFFIGCLDSSPGLYKKS